MHHLEKQMHEADKLSREKEKGDKKALKQRLKNQSKLDASVKLNSLGLSDMYRDILADLPAETIGDLLTYKTEGIRAAYTDYYNAHASNSTMEHYEWELGWENFVKQLNKICKPFNNDKKVFSKIHWTVDNAVSDVYDFPSKPEKTKKLAKTYSFNDTLKNLGLSKFTDDVLTDIPTIGKLLSLTVQDHLRIFSDYYMDYKDAREYKNISWRKYWKRYMKEVNKVYSACRGGVELVVLDWSEDMAVFQQQTKEEAEDEIQEIKHMPKLDKETPLHNIGLSDKTRLIIEYWWHNEEDNDDYITIDELTQLNSGALLMIYNDYYKKHPQETAIGYNTFIDELTSKVAVHFTCTWAEELADKSENKTQSPAHAFDLEALQNATKHLKKIDEAIRYLQMLGVSPHAVKIMQVDRQNLCDASMHYNFADIVIQSYNTIPE